MRRLAAIDDLPEPSIQIEDVSGFLRAENGLRMALRLHRDPVAGPDGFVEEEQADLEARAGAGDQGHIAVDADDLARHGQTHGIALA